MRKLRTVLKDCEAERDQLAVKVEELEREAVTGHLQVQASTEEVQNEVQRAEKEAAEREAALLATVETHVARIASLQATLAAVEARIAAREDALRLEITSLERKCQDTEAARDELAASHADASLPLLRELEAVTAAAAHAADTAADTEARLLSRVQVRSLASLSVATHGRFHNARVPLRARAGCRGCAAGCGDRRTRVPRARVSSRKCSERGCRSLGCVDGAARRCNR
jgi:chromosome segregation ATPase